MGLEPSDSLPKEISIEDEKDAMRFYVTQASILCRYSENIKEQRREDEMCIQMVACAVVMAMQTCSPPPFALNTYRTTPILYF